MNLQWYVKSWEELAKDELYEILALRIKVFVIEQNCPYQDMDGKDRKSLQVFALNANGTCVACTRLVEPGVSYPEWAIGRVANDPELRGRGLGREAMKRSMDYLRNECGNPNIRISAQLYLKKFYEDFGFVQVSESYLEDDIPHIEMLFKP